MGTWQDIERRRLALGMSRAELSRKAGISESTIFKGLRGNSKPIGSTYSACDRVLHAAEDAARAGCRELTQ